MDKALLLLISPTGSFFSKIAPSSSAPEAEGLPLNTPSKGIVDQDCLINYVGCDENLKCAGCRPYGAPFVFFVYNFEWIHRFLFSPYPQTIQNGRRR